MFYSRMFLLPDVFTAPFENRVAVVLANEVPGFEGTDIKYSISGCQLIIGFE